MAATREAAGSRRRADLLLVARGLFESRNRARAAIEAGLVLADGSPVRRPSDLVPEEAAITAEPAHPWVSRGGIKLVAAIEAFGVDPAGQGCLDVGASTGGFTDVLLARGAARVVAVDVGRGQLHPRLAADRRVTSLEATDVRRLGGLLPAGSIDLATVDVSFISLRLVLPNLVSYIKETGQIIVLVKPQFEVGRSGLGRGGIVRDPALQETSVASVSKMLSDLGFSLIGRMPSPIAGGDGNAEFLLGARRGG